jgi:hypothetical protein
MAEIYTSEAITFINSIIKRRYQYHSEPESEENSLYWILIVSLVLEGDYNNPQCTYARDRVFSLLGLAADKAEFDAFPDYSRTSVDVYEDLTRKFLAQGHIDILSYCQFPRVVRNRALSTWAPDWSMSIRCPGGNAQFSASGDGDTVNEVRFPDARGLWDPDWVGELSRGETLRYLGDVRSFSMKSSRIKRVSEEDATARIAIGNTMEYDDEEEKDEDGYYDVHGDEEEEEDDCLAFYKLVLK